MAATVPGRIQGSTVILDRAVPDLEGQRVHVTLEALPPAAENEELAAGESALPADPPLAQLMRRTLLSTAPDGTVELQFDASPQFTNAAGTIQGGMLAAMLDSALGLATRAALEPGQRVVTVEMSTRYFRQTQPGTIRARASILHRSSTLAHVQADLFDAEGTHLAHALGSLRIFAAAKP